MRRIPRLVALLLCALALAWAGAHAVSAAQRHGGGHGPVYHGGPIGRPHVFIGGYFYDPFWGPYPWWPGGVYPWYEPVYDTAAELHLHVKPTDAAVYVDGFYAGIVDDFDGVFQALRLAPGGHNVVLYRDGLQTAKYSVFLQPGTTFTIRLLMRPVTSGTTSEPPPAVVPVPAPPEGSYQLPRTPAAPNVPSDDEGAQP